MRSILALMYDSNNFHLLLILYYFLIIMRVCFHNSFISFLRIKVVALNFVSKFWKGKSIGESVYRFVNV